MDIGIGLPTHAPWGDGRRFVEWARRAEAHGFGSVAVSDRLLWSTPEPLTVLAAVAGATDRIRLQTSVLLAPLRANPLLFAKSVLTLDHLAGPDRLRLGLATGFREDDFTASGVPYRTRGARFDDLLLQLDDAFNDRAGLGLPPATTGGPPLLFGGTSAAALRRTAARGAGWLAGTASVQDLDEFVPALRAAWAAAGRTGAPRVVASAMFALGPDAKAAVDRAIAPYYAFAGEDWAREGVETALTSADQIAATVAEFAKHGCDELILTGNDPDPDQVDLLAEALRGRLRPGSTH
ncbi:LLM class flavin-dependent oxidoreductase [Cryptosporangium aurantiacum]|uniref:Flavin-dependent oxidoreductase, luciferase family (Includes alkanesulfonate monooxygenase SsuD and methylene tetrahydromethanopterin reductase) n=1 Tax=Cryptosporangium aurantiacum TaxID=134849 RepID=A0A1M7TY70_9ACTN|nr:LLM class flavin-dependent oxidoreductase [Cryptosporangium aurantiacum]SHN75593.1 Flavin-dependent oxidoreductase, luciferase family (includes alkanesulfonate monooxygenase SsuD and methylene tetrahydromethanopterin reductase) [Cryptosporangium aurantiacum]